MTIYGKKNYPTQTYMFYTYVHLYVCVYICSALVVYCFLYFLKKIELLKLTRCMI
jgi:hypothetical protein